MDHARGTREALPGSKPRGDALAGLILDEDVEMALQHEKALLDLVGVRGIALPRRHEHDRERKVLGRDHGRIVVLAGAAGADEAVLRALVAFDLGVLECRPVGAFLAVAPDEFLHDLLDRHADEFRRTGVSRNAHGKLLLFFNRVAIVARMKRQRNPGPTYPDCAMATGWRR